MTEKPLLVYENPRSVRRKWLGRWLGVPVYATPKALLNVLFIAPLMFVLTFVLSPRSRLLQRVGLAALLTAVFEGIATLHSIGHLVAGKIAGSPADDVVITATRQLTLYSGDQSDLPREVHLTRALGGPVANLLGGVAGLVLMPLLGNSPILLGWTLLNFVFGFGSLAPIESLDGGSIARHLR